MFPSWGISDKRSTWGEVSVDFVFMNEVNNTILVVELKNNIKRPREICSAYCQTLHRTLLFRQGYAPEKLLEAHRNCFDRAIDERGGIGAAQDFSFPSDPVIRALLMAESMSEGAIELLTDWNTNGLEALQRSIAKYVKVNEWQRLSNVLNERPIQMDELTVAPFVLGWYSGARNGHILEP